MIKTENWGTHDNNDVFLFTLDNNNGLTAEITNYGGIIKSLVFDGVDVVLGRNNLEEYLENSGCYGAFIGRNSNRIENAEFELDGKKYTLFKNNGVCNLHGGPMGFNKRVWNAEAVDGEEPSLILSGVSADGDQGFPANMNVKVTYTLTKDNSIKIHYEADADGDTLANMTNHSYFNLNGHASGQVYGHTVKSECDFYTPNTDGCFPTGEIRSVKGTAFDLTTPTKLGEHLLSDDEQVKLFDGFDHNFCINGKGFRKAITLTGDISGITMEVYTDLPGVQIYSGNGIHEDEICKDNVSYKKHQGICFETQAFPNATVYSHFPSIVLKKGEKYETVTEYKFSKR